MLAKEMNPAIISKVALEAIKALAQVIPQVLAKIGPEAFARAAIMREIAKVAPWIIAALGTGLTWLIVNASLKDNIRIAGRHGGTEVALEASSSRRRKTKKKQSTETVKHIVLESEQHRLPPKRALARKSLPSPKRTKKS